MKKSIKIITDVVLIAIIVLVAAIFAPKLAGIQPLAVLSGSMEPTYHVGSLVYVKTVDPDTIQTGDAITFHISDSTLVTHRVIAVNSAEQTFTTKGDANDVEDGGAVSFSNVVGKVVFNVPFLGYIAAFLSTKSGLIVLATVIAAVLILSFIPDILSDQKTGKEKGDILK